MVGASLARRAGAARACASRSSRRFRTMRRRNRASTSAPRRCRTAAAESSRRSGVWPRVRARRRRRSARFTSRIRAASALRASMRAEQGLAAMGYVVPNRALGRALWSRLARAPDMQVFCPGAGGADHGAASSAVALGDRRGRRADDRDRCPAGGGRRRRAVGRAQRLRRRRASRATTSRRR